MSEITGRLLADLFPDGVVRIVFIPIVGGGTETPMTAKDFRIFVSHLRYPSSQAGDWGIAYSKYI